LAVPEEEREAEVEVGCQAGSCRRRWCASRSASRGRSSTPSST
jgi:hypothetical protein